MVRGQNVLVRLRDDLPETRFYSPDPAVSSRGCISSLDSRTADSLTLSSIILGYDIHIGHVLPGLQSTRFGAFGVNYVQTG
jgi:hypothetical protein